ncbi:ClbS/DfsB family four-helix bundle protein [Aliirhizobium smilacinae]|uniref:ClbS/DfsB family four-helix bundle protein n=1 Tax=Aliirhizobium smilacinae TaxID=1395944 RepID=A0A5C4XQ43_9HYPH|nr:ClbS/DfsB family four-helix bundle protein [Rhizobium smilacinae]TNM65522.1 ClbS/DfsB family four-helix bundle protein [Rhizobium smilacinae]
MAVPGSKNELIAAISKTFDRLCEDLARVPPKRARDTSMEGHLAGKTMSPADLVAYLIGWNELVLKWLDRDDRGGKVDSPETGFKWNELGLLAEKFYADYDALDWPERLERLGAVKELLVSTISARSNDELYGKGWYGKWTKGRMIQFNTSSPYANARARIRKWLKAQC